MKGLQRIGYRRRSFQKRNCHAPSHPARVRSLAGLRCAGGRGKSPKRTWEYSLTKGDDRLCGPTLCCRSGILLDLRSPSAYATQKPRCSHFASWLRFEDPEARLPPASAVPRRALLDFSCRPASPCRALPVFSYRLPCTSPDSLQGLNFVQGKRGSVRQIALRTRFSACTSAVLLQAVVHFA